MKSIKFSKPKIIYEVVGKSSNGDWETIDYYKTLNAAQERAKRVEKQNKYPTIDINLIIDDDLVETYDIDGNPR